MIADREVGRERGRVQSLQVLRGAAALLVVVAHSIEHAPGRSGDPVTLTGRFGVDIFFVLSGFVIIYVAGDRQFKPGVFLLRRVWRVVPLYWMLTLLVAGTAMVIPNAFKTTQFSADYLLRSLAFVPTPLPGTNDWRPLFKLGWTLNYEMFFYVLVALMFWCRSMMMRAVVITIVLATLTLSYSFRSPGTVLAFYASLNLLPFIAGVWLAVLWHNGWVQAAPRWLSTSVLLSTLVATLYFYHLPFFDTKRAIGHIPMSVAAALIACSALMFEDQLGRLCGAQWLGDVSYSLYLVHMFVVGVGWAVLNRLRIEPGSILGVGGVVGMVAASLVAATVSYRLIEQPMMRLANRRRRHGLTGCPVASASLPTLEGASSVPCRGRG